MMLQEHYLTSKVFVAGGQPSFTYVGREFVGAHQTLEDHVQNYLDTGYKALTVTGPSKSGKTVLCRRVIPKDKGLWIQGGEIRTEEDFWTQVASSLNINISETHTQTDSHTVGGSFEISGQGKLPLVFEAGGKASSNVAGANQTSKTIVTARNLRNSALKALEASNIPLVVDDFHYISREVQKDIVRALKSPIFDGLRVVLIAVPHRAFDAVRSEREMTGRVDQLSINLWSRAELSAIVDQGSPLLNVKFPSEIVNDFLDQSQGSPHLMQEFCSKICIQNKIRETTDIEAILSVKDRLSFFKEIAASTSKPAFDLLARGPRQRSDRKTRRFKDGTSGDIYLAVLHALSDCGARSKMTYEDIRSSLRNILAEEMPQSHEIGRVLVNMSKIARDKIEGEAVLEWDEEETVLHIADPFFSFYLKWATQ